MQYTLPEMTVPGSGQAPGGESVQPSKGLRIYTLGRFTLVRDGQPLRYVRKSPAKPLQLLKALIASGGRQVGAVNLASILWPDKEGDQAQRTFDTTLHRLRKYLGDDSYLQMEDGRLTLNSDHVWVDVWECERQMTKLRGLLSHHINPDVTVDISLCSDSLIRYYQGHFLSREQSFCWSVSLEERLRNRFIHAMLALGNFWEQQGLPTKAIVCYQKGIEVDDLVETFYQRLILCLDRVGRQPEAIASYRQCVHVLRVVLGLQPTEETQAIYHSVLTHYRQQAG
jgi:two-component SAPR family response regulator